MKYLILIYINLNFNYNFKQGFYIHLMMLLLAVL
jgi:hypothetical protein